MNFKLTMTMVTVLLAGLCILMLLPKGPDKDNPVTSETTPLIADTSKLNITSITYLTGKNVEFKFVKEGDAWKMAEPSKAAIDSRLIEDVASAIKSATYRRKFAPGSGSKSAESTGTASPKKSLKFTDDKNKEYVLALGKSPNEGGIFATYNGDNTIYVLQSNPAEAFAEKTADDFRNKQIKQVDTSKITKLDIKTAKGEIHLAKTDGKWLFVSPPARANAVMVDEISQIFGNIQAVTFSTLDKKLAGIDPGVASVTAWVDESPFAAPSTAASQSQPAPKLTAVTLQFGVLTDPINRSMSNVYAALAGADDVFTFSRDAFNKINKEMKDLRDPAIIPASVNLTSATDLTITTDGAATVSANKKDGKWSLNAGLEGDPYAMSDYLGLIRDLRAINYADGVGDLKSIGLDPPHIKIEMAIPGQSQHEVVLVGKTDTDPNGGKTTSIMRQGEPTVYQIHAVDSDRLATTLVALRDKQVESLTADKIRKIEVAGALATVGITPPTPAAAPATGTAPATAPAAATAPAVPLTPGVTLVRDGNSWKVMKSAESYPADDSKISALLADFSPLVAGKYLDDKLPQGKPDITVVVTTLESALPPPATATAPASAPATMAATGTAPASAPATKISDVLPGLVSATVDPGKLVTHTLSLYKVETPATAPATTSAPATPSSTQPTITWKAAWDGQSPAWTFEPPAFLVEHVTKTTYNPSPASTQATTQPLAIAPQ